MDHSSWLVTCNFKLKKIPMAFRFEELKVWQMALDLSNEIDLLSKKFPVEERFSLSSQIKRAADSVVLNIAEGSTGQTKPEFKRFLDIALRSAVEVVACLFIAIKRNYISKEEFDKNYTAYEVICKMITKLRDSM
ncbi:MAG: four helix bundle protein [Chitinophagaceae bacterium]|nr:four helix bundle protein [Chitinophagaceae bacterium]